MSKTTIGFISASLIYLALTALLGLLLGVHYPVMARLIDTHVHFGLLGFFGMMVYGVAYHILPRFRGKPLKSESLAWAHLWLGNITLVGMGVFFPFAAYRAADWSMAKIFFVTFAAGQAISIFIFVYNLLFTLLPLTPVELPPALAAAKARAAAQQEKREQ